MTAVEGSVVLRGKHVHLREGDLIVLSDRSIVSHVLRPFNAGWSHVVSVVLHEGRLRSFSVCMHGGLTIEDIETYNAPHYTRLAVVRPSVARTTEQTVRYRLGVADILRAHVKDAREAYDPGIAEFAHAFFHMRKPATENKYICSEICATLVRASGAWWPERQSVSLRIDELARIVGRPERVF